MLTLWKKIYDQPRQHIKKQSHHFAGKVYILKSTFFPVLLYGCESWTIENVEHWGIDAFELWCWRRILRVPWTARRSSQSILKEIGLCRGPAPGGSRGTLRMNGVGEWERVRQSLGLSLKFIFARLLYTLNNIFGGSAYCLHTGHLKTLQQLDLQQKLDVTHILFSFTRVFLIIWPSGLLTFYHLHLVWLKQLQ